MEKEQMDQWKQNRPGERILDVGQCICVLCVTVLYSVCRCGSVHVGLYSLHTFLYVQEFGGVGGVRCVRA